MSTQSQFDPNYETTRIADEDSFHQKLRWKRTLNRFVGEIYIGKRAKLAHYRRILGRLTLPKQPSILEVGSGDGLFCFETATRLPNAKVVGLELNEIEANACNQQAINEGISNLQFVSGLLSARDWRDCFDMVFCLDVLEHVSEDLCFVEEMTGALKPGGMLLIHVPNRYYRDTDGTIHTVSDEDAWRINPGHVRNGYTAEELRDVMVKSGLEVNELIPSQGNPIARAHALYRKFEKVMPMRVAILPWIDRLIRMDLKSTPEHGNTLWAISMKPQGSEKK